MSIDFPEKVIITHKVLAQKNELMGISTYLIETLHITNDDTFNHDGNLGSHNLNADRIIVALSRALSPSYC